VRSAARSEDPENDGAFPAEASESGIDLGELGPPDRLDVLPDGARKVVAGSGLSRKQPEKNVGKRHWITISTLI
jgi:hypothetical protein